MAGHNSYSLNSRTSGIGNVLGSIRQKVILLPRHNSKDSPHKSNRSTGVSHHTSTSTNSPKSLPRGKKKHIDKAGGKKAKQIPLKKKKISKVDKNIQKLPDIF